MVENNKISKKNDQGPQPEASDVIPDQQSFENGVVNNTEGGNEMPDTNTTDGNAGGESASGAQPAATSVADAKEYSGDEASSLFNKKQPAEKGAGASKDKEHQGETAKEYSGDEASSLFDKKQPAKNEAGDSKETGETAIEDSGDEASSLDKKKPAENGSDDSKDKQRQGETDSADKAGSSVDKKKPAKNEAGGSKDKQHQGETDSADKAGSSVDKKKPAENGAGGSNNKQQGETDGAPDAVGAIGGEGSANEGVAVGGGTTAASAAASAPENQRTPRENAREGSRTDRPIRVRVQIRNGLQFKRYYLI